MFEDNVVPFLEHVRRYIGYRYDDLDEAALTGALERTDDESIDGWFSYPLPGTPPLTVSLARAVGGSEVSVRPEGDIDPVLRARFETLFDLLQRTHDDARAHSMVVHGSGATRDCQPGHLSVRGDR